MFQNLMDIEVLSASPTLCFMITTFINVKRESFEISIFSNSTYFAAHYTFLKSLFHIDDGLIKSLCKIYSLSVGHLLIIYSLFLAKK
jgi:hypothetical protein